MIIEHFGTTARCHLDADDVEALRGCLRLDRWAKELPGDWQHPDTQADLERKIAAVLAILAAGFVTVTTHGEGGEVGLDETSGALMGTLYSHDTRAYAVWYDSLAPWTLPLEPRR